MQRIAVEDVIVNERREQIVRSRDRMGIAGKMEIDLFHGDDLCPASARSASLNPEHRTKGRLAKRHNGAMAKTTEPHGQSYGSRRLSFSQRCRVYGCNQDITSLRSMLEPIQGGEGNFAHVPSVGMDFIWREPQELADFLNGTKVGQPTMISIVHENLSVLWPRRSPELDRLSKNERATNADS